jgi:hypothetical protein
MDWNSIAAGETGQDLMSPINARGGGRAFGPKETDVTGGSAAMGSSGALFGLPPTLFPGCRPRLGVVS